MKRHDALPDVVNFHVPPLTPLRLMLVGEPVEPRPAPLTQLVKHGFPLRHATLNGRQQLLCGVKPDGLKQKRVRLVRRQNGP